MTPLDTDALRFAVQGIERATLAALHPEDWTRPFLRIEKPVMDAIMVVIRSMRTIP